jgi:hypothetical protein
MNFTATDGQTRDSQKISFFQKDFRVEFSRVPINLQVTAAGAAGKLQTYRKKRISCKTKCKKI